jgi:hypothetical protein
MTSTSTSKYDKILLNHRKTIVQLIEPYITNIEHTEFFLGLESIVNTTPENLIEFFKENKQKLNIPQLDTYNNYEVIYRNNTAKDRYEMKWHYDNKKLIKHKISDLHKIHNVQLIHMDDKYIYGLYTNKPVKYTIIIYMDTYIEDFTGGEFHFYNRTIYPRRGMLLFFTADELHKVSLLKSGRRRAVIVKIY